MDCFEKLYHEIRDRFSKDDEMAFEHMSEPLSSIMKECREKLSQPIINSSKPNNRLLAAVFNLFKKHDWGKWEHVMYVEEYSTWIRNYEILRRECKVTGLTQYKRIYVKDCVHDLTAKLNAWLLYKNGK